MPVLDFHIIVRIENKRDDLHSSILRNIFKYSTFEKINLDNQ